MEVKTVLSCKSWEVKLLIFRMQKCGEKFLERKFRIFYDFYLKIDFKETLYPSSPSLIDITPWEPVA
jgi:hypothetical protein